MAQRNTKLTQEEFEDRVYQLNPSIKILSKYIRRKDRVECLCLNCNNKWNPTADTLLAGRGCPVCAVKKRTQCIAQSNEAFVEKFNKNGNSNVELLEKYKNSYTKIHCKCKMCGNEWYVIPPSLLQGHGCPLCGQEYAKTSQNKSHEQFMKDFEAKGNPNIEIIGKYISCSNPIKVKCKKCGKIWDMSPIKLLYKGQGCKDCWYKHNTKENHHNWNPNKTDEERISEREYSEYKDFIQSVLRRDNYTCQITGQVGGKLNVHHLNGYNWDKENRTNINNGITLSEEIHKEFHTLYGRGNNTKEQFIDFVNYLHNQKRITNDGYNSLMEKLK